MVSSGPQPCGPLICAEHAVAAITVVERADDPRAVRPARTGTTGGAHGRRLLEQPVLEQQDFVELREQRGGRRGAVGDIDGRERCGPSGGTRNQRPLPRRPPWSWCWRARPHASPALLARLLQARVPVVMMKCAAARGRPEGKMHVRDGDSLAVRTVTARIAIKRLAQRLADEGCIAKHSSAEERAARQVKGTLLATPSAVCRQTGDESNRFHCRAVPIPPRSPCDPAASRRHRD